MNPAHKNPAHKGIKAGDRVYYRNSYGQGFYALVERVHGERLIVKRDEWYARECIDLRDYVMSRHFPAGEGGGS